MKRRRFLKMSAGSLLLAPYIISRNTSLFADPLSSPIISVIDDNASVLNYVRGKIPNSDNALVDTVTSFTVNHARIANMVDTAIMELTGKTTVGKAWESLFPSGHPHAGTKIGLKVNFAYWSRGTDNNFNTTICPYGAKAAVSEAIITGLTQMMDGTFPVENITVYDISITIGPGRNNPVVQGYRPVPIEDPGKYKDFRKGTYGIHWVNIRRDSDILPDAPQFIAAPDFPKEYQAPQRIIPPSYQNDFTINVAVAKDHRSAGVTGVMKNTYGCTDNCGATHGDRWKDIDTPYPGTRLCVPVFYKEINRHSPCILNVMDALVGVYNGGPTTGSVFHANEIAISRDPVAIDTYLLNMVNDHRKKNGLPILNTEDGRAPDGHPNAPNIRIASRVHELGGMSQDYLKTLNISGESIQNDLPSLGKSQSRLGDANITGSMYQLPVYLDKSGRTHHIESRIEDLKGNVIRDYRSISTKSSLTEISWDIKNNKKSKVREGIYVWYVTVDGITHTRTLNLS